MVRRPVRLSPALPNKKPQPEASRVCLRQRRCWCGSVVGPAGAVVADVAVLRTFQFKLRARSGVFPFWQSDQWVAWILELAGRAL